MSGTSADGRESQPRGGAYSFSLDTVGKANSTKSHEYPRKMSPDALQTLEKTVMEVWVSFSNGMTSSLKYTTWIPTIHIGKKQKLQRSDRIGVQYSVKAAADLSLDMADFLNLRSIRFPMLESRLGFAEGLSHKQFMILINHDSDAVQ